MHNNTITISYARVSSENNRLSIGKQYKLLRDVCPDNIYVCVKSGAIEFTEDFKNYILERRSENKRICLNVVAFDRLTRNFADLDFLGKHVSKIYVLDDEKIYDVETDLSEIAAKIGLSVSEHKLIVARFNRYKTVKKRERSDDDIEMKMANIKRRCIAAKRNLIYYGISEETIHDIEQFISISQHLNSLQIWKNLVSVGKKLGINCLIDEYEDYLALYKKYPRHNEVFRISTTNLKKYLQNTINEKVFLNQMINAYVSYNNIDEKELLNDMMDKL